MRREETLARLLQSFITVVLREAAQSEIDSVTTALSQGGLCSFEVTFEGPQAARIIQELKAQKRQWLVGAGTVLDLATLRAASEAGADFVFCPHVDLQLLNYANEAGILLIPGVLTPTEIALATAHGAPLVKLFPASSLGPGHLQALRGPFPDLKCIPTGGINSENLADFIRAGACGVGMGGALVDAAAIKRRDWDALRQAAKKVRKIAEETIVSMELQRL
jgi:2-dehydro-3-deoxyphosphogluconate aldolase/(4S)-4-hydroxy-2-oxoglutarate aldolase